MKKYFKFILPILLSLLITVVFSISSCKKSDDDNNYKSETYEISSDVVNIPTEIYETVTSVSGGMGEGEIIFDTKDSHVSSLKSGDILVSGPIDAAPNGFLVEVTDISEEGEMIKVYTKPATLEDVFIYLDMDISKALTNNDLNGTPQLKNGSVFNPGSYDGEFFYTEIDETLYEDNVVSIKATGHVEIDPSFNFSLKIRGGKINKLEFKASIKETANLQIEALGEVSYNPETNIGTFRFHPIVFFAGFVPIVITPKIDLKVGAEVSITASAVSSVDQSAELVAGVKYENQQWSPISEFNKSFLFNPPQLTATGLIKGYAGPELNILLYGFVGPYADLMAYLELDADISGNPWWELYGGASVGVGVKASAFGGDLFNVYYPDVIEYKILLAQADVQSDGELRGIVKDAITNSPIQGVVIAIEKNQNPVTSSSTLSTGEFSINMPSGDGYNISFSKNGYISATYNNVEVLSGSPTILEPVLQIDDNHSGVGDISGQIVNALNGDGVSGIYLQLREGINTTVGNVIGSATTTSNGNYSINNIDAGNYTIEATASGYGTTHFTVISIGGQLTDNQDATITPGMNDGEVRIILTWDSTPYDLDSHLTGPILGSNDRFHVYFNGESFLHNGEVYCALDHDDIESYGPETVTIYHQTDGVYRYSVHDYSNKNSINSTALSNSSAQVRVYSGGDMISHFNIPTNTGGTLWTVFEIDGDVLSPVNNLSYESSPGDVTSSVKTDSKLIRNLPAK